MSPLSDRSLTTDRETARHSPKGDYTDFQLMLELWHSGNAGRDVALEIADQNRNRATRTTGAPL